MQIAIQSMTVLNANCRSRYEQFHFIHINCASKNRSCRRRLREPSRAFEKNLRMNFDREMNQTIQDELERSNWAEKRSDCQSRHQN